MKSDDVSSINGRFELQGEKRTEGISVTTLNEQSKQDKHL